MNRAEFEKRFEDVRRRAKLALDERQALLDLYERSYLIDNFKVTLFLSHQLYHDRLELNYSATCADCARAFGACLCELPTILVTVVEDICNRWNANELDELPRELVFDEGHPWGEDTEDIRMAEENIAKSKRTWTLDEVETELGFNNDQK